MSRIESEMPISHPGGEGKSSAVYMTLELRSWLEKEIWKSLAYMVFHAISFFTYYQNKTHPRLLDLLKTFLAMEPQMKWC